jgi:hydroxymethylpyrimidine pyrophosphatase-like HAD family hydrolase
MLFRRVRRELPALTDWINERFEATLYEDSFSPFCLIAGSNEDADAIMERLDAFCRVIPHLTVMRNDVYARFSHADFTKGTALAEIARQLGIAREHILVAGDHFNDLPMLRKELAEHLVAPANAIDPVKEAVRRQGGYVSRATRGEGVAEGLRRVLETTGWGRG